MIEKHVKNDKNKTGILNGHAEIYVGILQRNPDHLFKQLKTLEENLIYDYDIVCFGEKYEKKCIFEQIKEMSKNINHREDRWVRNDKG